MFFGFFRYSHLEQITVALHIKSLLEGGGRIAPPHIYSSLDLLGVW